VNYKKQYLNLDLNSQHGYQAVLDLIRTADIVLMNFKHEDQEKYNLADSTLHRLNPGLIIGKISGFGDESDRVAYDLILQAETGFMSMNGEPQSPPTKMPVALIDVLAGHHLKEGILVALFERQKTNKGKVVSVSLYDAAVSSLVNQASNYLMRKMVPLRQGSLHPNIAPYGEIFKTKDERYITFAIGSQKHFESLLTCINARELIKDVRFLTNQLRIKNRTSLEQEISIKIENLYMVELLEDLHALHVPCGEIKNLKQVFKTKEAQQLIREEKMFDKITKRVTSIAFKMH
jgi:crotonobetainyl-CoA:carnitine CoA-transferase CaiB-like acyl-CoA transferase